MSLRNPFSGFLAVCLMASLMLATGCGRTASPSSALSEGCSDGASSFVSSTTTASTTEATTTTTTATTVSAGQAQVKALLQSGRVAQIYRSTWDSVFGRLQKNGFLQESLTGRYKGEYVRSIGAFAILAVEAGETDAAGRALRFVTDLMEQKNLPYLPFTITADGAVRQEDEPDGRAHFLLGWARYIAASGDSAYFAQSWPRMKREMEALCGDEYIDPQKKLLRNRRLTHSRMRNGTDYPDALDLLSNSFLLAALEELAPLAERYKDTATAATARTTATLLREGLQENLTRTVNGKTVYRELLYYDGGKYTPENGVSWICLAPFANRLDGEIWKNTVEYTRQRLWRATDAGGYLAVECTANGTVKNRILGKSVGWDLAAAADSGDYTHILEALKFLEKYHTGNIYMEWMTPLSGGWRLVDCGNGEQAIWFLWGVLQVRKSLGLSAAP